MRRIIWFIVIAWLGLTASLYAQWIVRNGGLPTTFQTMCIDAIDKDVAILSASNRVPGSLYRTLDAGILWENIGCPSTEYVLYPSATDSLNIWIATHTARIFYTSDGGKTWVKQYADSSKTRFLNYIEMFDPMNGIAMGDALADTLPPVFLRTSDGGAHWISTNDSAIGGYSFSEYHMLSFMNADTGYFYSIGIPAMEKLYRTFDAGRTWQSTNFPKSPVMCLKFYNERIGIVTKLFGTVCRTLDGGETWEEIPNVVTSWVADIEFMKGDPSKVWILSENQLLFSSDTGRTWRLHTPCAQRYRDLNFPDPAHGWLVGDNLVLYIENPLAGFQSEIEGIIPPKSYALYQNYPNPFNPSTTIRYALPENSRVKLEVFNLLGERVAELVNADESAGYKQVVWNAQVASGIYIYKLSAIQSENPVKRFTVSKKMLLMR